MRLSQVWDARESTNVRAYTYMCAREQVQTLSARGPFSRSCPWPRQWVVSTLCSSPHCARCLPFWRALLPRSLQPLRHRDCDTAPQQPIHNTLCAQCMLRRQACEAQLVSPQRRQLSENHLLTRTARLRCVEARAHEAHQHQRRRRACAPRERMQRRTCWLQAHGVVCFQTVLLCGLSLILPAWGGDQPSSPRLISSSVKRSPCHRLVPQG